MAFTLARWFTPATEANAPEDDFVREDILSAVAQATIVAVSGKTTMVKTPKGIVAIEAKSVQGCPIVDFDFVEDGRWNHIRFWMNASSVKSLGDILRTKPRGNFDDLFVYGGRA